MGRRDPGVAVGGGLVCLGLAAAAASMAVDLDQSGGWGPRLFPLVGSAAILAAGVAEIAGGGPRRAPPAAAGPSDPRAVLALAMLAVLYAWAMGQVGHLVSTAVAAPLAMATFGVRRPAALLAGAILAPLAYHLIFFRALGVFPPTGARFDLLDHVPL